MLLLAFCYALVALFVGYLLYNQYSLGRARNSIKYRIHVIGRRGKSSVIQYVTAVLRSAGLETYGRTTGSNGRIILPDGTNIRAEHRRDTTNVGGQVEAIRSFAKHGAQAIVMQCAAYRPSYQRLLERRAMRSQVAIITNIRINQRSAINETSREAARRLAEWIPHNAYVITAERQPELLDILAKACQRKRSRLIPVKGASVKLKSLRDFDLIPRRDDVAIGLAVARLFNVPPEQALDVMADAKPDQAHRLEHLSIAGKEVVWANIFGVSDKKNFAAMSGLLAKQFPGHYRIAVLNNQSTRPNAAAKFSALAMDPLHAQSLVVLGDYDDRVRTLVRRGVQVSALGNMSLYAHVSGDVLLDQILHLTDQPKVLLVGIGVGRTPQSDQMLRYFQALTSGTASRAPSASKGFPYV